MFHENDGGCRTDGTFGDEPFTPGVSIPAGHGPQCEDGVMSVTPPGPGPSWQVSSGGRRGRRVPARVWLLVAVLVVIILLTGTSTLRNWWAHRIHDVTGGSQVGDYLLGLVVGLLPLLAVVVAAAVTRRRGPRRVFRMLWAGAIGFVAAYLLAPSPVRYLTDAGSRHVFDQEAPRYLAGVATGVAVWLVAVVIALLRARRSWRRFVDRHTGPPPDEPSHRVIDI
jgi:hypothetical protein